MDRLKEKFDREGVNFVSDEGKIGRKTDLDKPQSVTNPGPNPYGAQPPMAPPRKGHISNAMEDIRNVNMGGSMGSNEVNPIKSVIS